MSHSGDTPPNGGDDRIDFELSDDVLVEDRAEVCEPRMCKVILLNDDYTTMEFVVLVLEQIFHKSPSEAQQVMLHVHQRGAGVAGVFTKEVAETKVMLVHQLAKSHKFPLKCVIELE